MADTDDHDPIGSARAALARGLVRRGIGILNRALQEGRAPLDAWFLKSRFLNSIGFNRAAAEMVDGALARIDSAPDRIAMFEEQAFLWAECDHGEQAFRSAEGAAALGSRSLRTHYLRGRALALLGRLGEARDEMNDVLKLDPDNSDAHRALKMIAAVAPPDASRRWWQFWRQ